MALINIGVSEKALKLILTKLEDIKMTQKELADKLDAATAQIDKVATETTASLKEISDLKALLAAGGAVTPDVEASLGRLESHLQAADDLVTDAAPPAP